MMNAILLAAALVVGGVPVQGATSATNAEVETNTRALRITPRPLDPAFGGARGCYAYSGTSGVIAAALAANAVVFAMRFDPTVGSDVAVIYYIKVAFLPLTLFTAATLTDATSFDMFIGRTFTAMYTGGTAATLTGDNLKVRTSFASTSMANISIATTAAFTGGTVTLPTHPFLQTLRRPNWVNPNTAAGTPIELVQNSDRSGNTEMAFDVGDGEYPIVLADQEGLVLRNRTVWPAAGTGQITVTIRWCEATAY